MASEVFPVPVAPVDRDHSYADFFARQLNRFYWLNTSVGNIGLTNTAKVAFCRKVLGRDDEIPFTIKRHPLLRFPLHLTTADITTKREVLDDRVYELPDELERRINGQVVVDIGANIGIASTYFATRFPDSRVIAIDPNGRNEDFLRRNAAEYDGQICPVGAALSPEPGRVALVFGETVDRGYHNSHLYSNELCRGKPAGFAKAITPSDVVALVGVGNRIGLLKVDIEGAELPNCKAIGPLFDITDVLAIETHDRTVPGCAAAVSQAATASGLVRYPQDGHTTIFTRV